MQQNAEQQTDKELMLCVANGDTHAFATLTMRHGQYMFAVAYRMLADTAQAEDAVQDVLIKVWTAAPQWQPTTAKWTTWLHTVLVRHCLDMLRKRKPAADVDVGDVVDDIARSPLQLVVNNERRLHVLAALQRLPEQQRAAVILTYYHGLSNAEVAQVLGSTVKAVESMLVRGRKALRAHIGDEWEESA
jgi:RNA polymerase sigma-70 factor (ECF subfamily)